MDSLDNELSRLFKLAKNDPPSEGAPPLGFATRVLAIVRAEETSDSAGTCRGAVIWSCALAVAAGAFSCAYMQSQWELFTVRGVEMRLANSAVWAQWQ